MKRIVLVRHGETEWHAENRYAGSSDVALTARGLQQAELLGQWARSAGLRAIWCSTLSRARHTAQPAADATGLPLHVDARLRELHFGRGEGMTDQEMQEAFPEQRKAFLEDPARYFLPDGEDPALAVARAEEALRELAATLNDGERALVVAHNTLIRLLMCHLLGLSLSKYRDVFPQLANATCTEFGFRANGVAVLAFNAPLILPTKGTE